MHITGCNPHPVWWQKRFLRVSATYALTSRVRCLSSLQMIASSRRAELNGILAFIPDGSDDSNRIPIGLPLANVKISSRAFCGRRSYDFLILNSRCPYYLLLFTPRPVAIG